MGIWGYAHTPLALSHLCVNSEVSLKMVPELCHNTCPSSALQWINHILPTSSKMNISYRFSSDLSTFIIPFQNQRYMFIIQYLKEFWQFLLDKEKNDDECEKCRHHIWRMCCLYMSQVLSVNPEISLFFRLLASIYLFLVDAILLGCGGCAHSTEES